MAARRETRGIKQIFKGSTPAVDLPRCLEIAGIGTLAGSYNYATRMPPRFNREFGLPPHLSGFRSKQRLFSHSNGRARPQRLNAAASARAAPIEGKKIMSINDEPVAGAKPDSGVPGVLTGRDHGSVTSRNPTGGEVALDRYSRKANSALEQPPLPHAWTPPEP
jgi:hypothetical protein